MTVFAVTKTMYVVLKDWNLHVAMKLDCVPVSALMPMQKYAVQQKALFSFAHCLKVRLFEFGGIMHFV